MLENLKYGMTHESGGVGKLFLQDRMQDTMDGVGISQKLNFAIADILVEQTASVKKQFFSNYMLDATVMDGSLGFKKSFTGNKTLSMVLAVSKNIGTHNDVYVNRSPLANYIARSAKIEFATPVLDMFNISANATFKNQNYQDAPAVIYSDMRNDYQKSLGINASKPIGSSMLLGASLNKTYNGSNYEETKYNKTTFGVTLTKVFNIL